MTTRLAVLVTPHDGPPYQDLLYENVEALGVRIVYDDGPTFSQTLNIALMPAILLWRRAQGCRVLHIHWLFQFSLPWAKASPWSRRAMEYWFDLYLGVARVLRYAIVWTAHDLLPHEPLFASDTRARTRLLRDAGAVIALSDATADELRDLGARSVRVIPFGSYAGPYPVSLTREEARSSFGLDDQDFVVSLIGRLEPYKGADILLNAIALLPATSRMKVLLAGTCPDKDYLTTLRQLAGRFPHRVVTTFSWIPDSDLARFYQASDVAAFAFREITNSGSVLLAQSFGKPVVIPDLANLRDIPATSAIRADADADSLASALQAAEHLTKTQFDAMSEASFGWANRISWPEAARATREAYDDALSLRDARS